MQLYRMSDIWEKLKHQSLGAPLPTSFSSFAASLESIYIKGIHDFKSVCDELNKAKVQAPLSGKVKWNESVLMNELKLLNAKLDKDYAENGLGA